MFSLSHRFASLLTSLCYPTLASKLLSSHLNLFPSLLSLSHRFLLHSVTSHSHFRTPILLSQPLPFFSIPLSPLCFTSYFTLLPHTHTSELLSYHLNLFPSFLYLSHRFSSLLTLLCYLTLTSELLSSLLTLFPSFLNLSHRSSSLLHSVTSHALPSLPNTFPSHLHHIFTLFPLP